MKKERLQNLKHKMIDYKRFSFIFLFISAFLNIGSALPFEGRTSGKVELLHIAGYGLLIISLLCFLGLRKAKKQYEENL